MTKNNRTPRAGRRGKVFLSLFLSLGTIGTLLYFEQMEVIFVLTLVGLIVLLLLVAFSDLEKVGVQAQIEAHLIEESDTEGTSPQKEMKKADRSDRNAVGASGQRRSENRRIVL